MSVFITGGSRGIGAGIVDAALREGYDVAFTYVQAEDAALRVQQRAKEEYPDRRCMAFQLDVTSAAQVEEVGDRVLDEFGNVEIVVNCAGKNDDNLLVSMTDEQWQGVLDTNLSGPFFVCRHFLPQMMSNRYGRIINISSIAAGGSSGQVNYAASKAGLLALTACIAKEYGRKGITANAVVPGIFDTDMTRETLPEQAKEYWKQYCPIPKGRFGELQEGGDVVMFLASKKASYVNGEVINVTGGLNWIY